MKKFYLLLLFVSCSSIYAQLDREVEDIANLEKKSAFKKMNLTVNPDTYNYDVTYHKLEFTVDPAVFYISGKVTTTYTALSDMTSLVFDLARITDDTDPHFATQIEVSSVKKNGANLAFTRTNTELIITLPTTQTTGTSATVEITYAGAPAGSGFGSFTTDVHGDNQPVLWTLSEPFGARDWWPCKQDLNDKVNSIDVYITAPTEYTSVSNGLQQSKIDNGNGTTTTYFHHGHAIPAYLIAIAVSDYQTYTQQGGLGTAESPFFPIINYLWPETADANIASVASTPDIINFYEATFVPYGFRDEKYGHCQFGWGGGMEHTTVSFMTAGNNGGYSRGLIAHEMGHQWFGDKVTCGSWKDIWLNEGFATYLNMLVIQHFDGETSFITNKSSLINNITNITSANDLAVYLTDTEALSVNRIFSSRVTYNKGAMVLNMLRFKLGDTNFFQGLRNYLNDPGLAYGYAHTPDLQNHLEATSGINLTEFFNDWVYKKGYPSYTITVANDAPGTAKIQIGQTQSNPSVNFFEMPVPIRLTGSGGQQQDYVLDNTSNGQQFLVNVPFTVTGVLFDVKKDLISRNNVANLGTLAVSNFDIQNSIVIYPNPVSSDLNIEIPNSITIKNVLIYNVLGQKVGVFQSKNIPVNTLSNGIYSIQIETSEGVFHKKFIKK